MASADAHGDAPAAAAAPDFKDIEETRGQLRAAFEKLDKDLMEALMRPLQAFCLNPTTLKVVGPRVRKAKLEGSASAGPNRENPVDKSFYRFCVRVAVPGDFPRCEDFDDEAGKALTQLAEAAIRPVLLEFTETNAGLFKERQCTVHTSLVVGKNREFPACDASFLRFHVRIESAKVEVRAPT